MTYTKCSVYVMGVSCLLGVGFCLFYLLMSSHSIASATCAQPCGENNIGRQKCYIIFYFSL